MKRRRLMLAIGAALLVGGWGAIQFTKEKYIRTFDYEEAQPGEHYGWVVYERYAYTFRQTQRSTLEIAADR